MLVTDVPAFRNFWYPVAFAEDLADGPIARTVLGERLVVWATDDGVAAARDVCPHRASALSIGWVENGCVVCPYHGWQFGGDGKAAVIPQLDPSLPIPPKAKLSTVHATERYGVVWISLEEPVGGLPEIEQFDDPTYRTIRQFDEVWAAAAPRLVDNSFDPAHVAYVHKETFGTPENARIDPPEITFTDEGLESRTEMVVENHLDVAQRANQIGEQRTVRTTVSRFVAPFLRVMSITYPNGLHHMLVTGICPVDDEHLRLVQWAIRNDTEADVPAEDVVAFDRAVTLEDQWLLEHTEPDYELGQTDLVHLKVDRGTLAVRKIYRQIVDGTWPALASRAGSAAAPVAITGSAAADVPVVDISAFDGDDPDARRRVAEAVAEACTEVGFVLVSGHGVADALLDEFYEVSKAFYQLPLETKLRWKSPIDSLYQGYACPGDGPGYHTSERQSFNVGRYDTVAEAIAAGAPDDIGDHMHDALWPDVPESFRSVWRAYFAEMDALTQRLMRVFEAGLGLTNGRLSEFVGNDPSTLVANYYSDDIDAGHEPSPFRFKAHRDGDIFTMLSQDDGPGSLQLHQRHRGWRDVLPVPGTYVVNIGEQLERLTNDRFVATPHRVLTPPEGSDRSIPRMSSPFFVKASLDATIAPLPELVGPGEDPHYEPITGRDWLNRNIADIYAGNDSTVRFEQLADSDPSLR
ncbi:isopenicillin N synthase-like dioxygenase [Ilumatobacter fluminis]|uniref:Isopenicillin N synthase-like dioxygenase n=1 Tax=Ilumatobacter fluminis TaxID=467091 RepID=A0A4R7I2W3_9ACTN|nr:2-oxoglutarate and iron-dependent oxygenase domain-containing protein [Ilumatobacter fluminis]TDT16893.1 isopenicillin N synthase-like dioxygenase [Ilumatobacter fluminis]